MGNESIQQRGRRQPRAGRPPTLPRQIAEAKKLREEIQSYVRMGLQSLVRELPSLIADEIASAKEGDSKARRYLIDLAFKFHKIEDEGDTPMGKIFQQFVVKVEEGGKFEVAGDRTGNLEELECPTIEGTGRSVL